MTFDAFIETGWNEHAERTQEVARRLADSLAMIETPAHVAPYARLVTHVYGEHLGEWQRGIGVLEAIGMLPPSAGEAEAAVLARNLAVLRYGSGNRGSIDGLAVEDRIAVLATAASAIAGRLGYRDAIAAYEAALQLAAAGLPDRSPALRALAVGGNNLAAALETKPGRDAEETRGMLVAAEGGVHYWQLAGTWLEEERAHYRLARSRIAAGLAEGAAASAQRCLDVCAAHDAPAFERFFGYAALALAQRGAGRHDAAAAARREALAAYERVPEDERAWCAQDLAELDA
jgi:hypothetical protein